MGEEWWESDGLFLVCLPTNRPRLRSNPELYLNRVNQATQLHKTRQPHRPLPTSLGLQEKLRCTRLSCLPQNQTAWPQEARKLRDPRMHIITIDSISHRRSFRH